jgi:DNA (cytosine-5)-methyltransferase 1
MKAIDLYSGIGGWSLGLKMAGIDVIKSFEYWQPAIDTYNKNFNKNITKIDLREINLKTLKIKPHEIDIVVGSPPCTQFSYANKGGTGDINDGLVDIKIFFDFINYFKPKYWAMENVPRVKSVIENHLNKSGELYKYKPIFKNASIKIINCSEFGVPQKRKRMIAGNIDFGLMNTYRTKMEEKSLGKVIKSLKKNIIIDSNYEKLNKKVTDHIFEDCLDKETERINKSMKTEHPIYNKMSFPDNLKNPSRTITATCTKVSRESIIVPEGKDYRRLTVRERAAIQTFPNDFQFSGNSYTAKIKMIGNAIPPILTYLIAKVMTKNNASDINQALDYKNLRFKPNSLANSSVPEKSRGTFRKNRKFKYCITGLRFGSGVRFQLQNNFKRNIIYWTVEYFFGSSKTIIQKKLNKSLLEDCEKFVDKKSLTSILNKYLILKNINPNLLQSVWTRAMDGDSPFKVLDQLGLMFEEVLELVKNSESNKIESFVHNVHTKLIMDLKDKKKFKLGEKYINNHEKIFCGFIIGSWFNQKH